MSLPNVFRKRRSGGPALSFLIKESAEAYHAQRSKFLTSHQLADFRKCPALYQKKKLGLIPDEDRPAYLVGRAAHSLILEGQKAFDADFAVGGPINEKTGRPFGPTTKAYAEWVAAQDRDVLTDAQFELVTRLAEGVKAHEKAMELLSAGIPEGVARANYCGEPSQVRVDFFNPEKGLIDLKTADTLDYFEADARRYGYPFQLSFYRAILEKVSGTKFPVYLIGIEKREPFRCGVWRVKEDVLGICQRENEDAIARLKVCKETDTWETGYEQLRTFDWI